MDVAVSELPESPLSAREGSSGFLIGDDFVVWGGSSGERADEEYHDDGAAYDTVTREWRMLPAPPMRAPYGHVAAANATGLAVFEAPPSSPTEDFSVSGYHLDLDLGEWQALTPPPFTPGSGFRKDGVTVGDLMLFHASEGIYAYRPEEDTWIKEETQGEVHRVLPADHEPGRGPEGEFYSLEEYDDGLALVHRRALDLSPITHLPVPDSEGAMDYGILRSEEGAVYVLLRSDGEIHIMRTADGEDGRGWEHVDTAHRSSFHTPYSTSFPDTGVMWARDGALISASPLGISSYEVADGEFFFHATQVDESRSCGAGSAMSPTEAGIIVWGGQSCLPETPGQVDTGYEVALPSQGRGEGD
ncbi:Kelch repeat-containing protein [Nocardiopsis xinjiangensis]|uniref:kelch repeat-containing protein n=1 Tax=Nocardiopsis xinjiangensis TaxID=124285 RepID=UPI001268A6F8|nr:kelch repeat-containing protein [Nocardiopsis xinjiangensis]